MHEDRKRKWESVDKQAQQSELMMKALFWVGSILAENKVSKSKYKE
jgi:hypothetical protein